jgi:3-phenylpropionate/trans-cinnamate dioxygenase ferredoxin reductase subunit
VTSSDGVLIVGASLAGLRAATALRSAGFDAPITVVGAEPHLPYDRPPLSKQVLRGEWPAERAALITSKQLEELDVQLELGCRATTLDLDAHRVRLADGTTLAYRTVVLATGASARPSPWTVPSGIHVLRTIDDCLALSAELRRAEPVVVIGAGFIGTEVAHAARSLGCPVSIVDPVAQPMQRLAGGELGALLTALHGKHGVDAHLGVAVTSIAGRSGDLRVQLSDGSSLSASTVVVGIGAVPNTDWLRSSGLVIDDGVECDPQLRASGRPDVFAIGDVARWPHAGTGRLTRSEHWTNAVDQANYVAGVITGQDHPSRYIGTDYVWSDQYDWKVQLVGWRARDGRSHVVRSRSGAAVPRFAVVHEGDAGQATGVIAVNWPKAMVQTRRRIADASPASQLVGDLEAS